MLIGRRGLMTGALAAVPFAALAQDKHWLVGTWRGTLGNGFNGRGGNQRTMLIQAVAPSGEVTGGWGSLNAPRVGGARFTLAGDTLTVITGADSQVSLKRAGDKLRGQFRVMANGKTFPIEMSRE
jgi:hypothetical protein